MYIPLISAIKNKYTESLMLRIFLLTSLIFFILCSMNFLSAQNAVIQVYDPQSLLLRTNGLWQMKFLNLEDNLIRPLQMELEAYYASLLPGQFSTDSSRTETRESVNPVSSREVFKLFYNKQRVDEKTVLRQQWEAAFGFDVWRPYYEYRKIERLIKNKFSLQIFKFKGEPRMEKDKIFYVFAASF